MEKALKMMMPIKEAVDLTGLSYSFIRKLCINEKIRYVRSGTKYYVNTESLLDYCGKSDLR